MIDFSAITVTAISMTGHWDTVAVIVIFILLLCTLLLILRKHIRKEKEIKENYDAFVSLSHDICTPLTLIKAPLSEIELNIETSEECRKLVSDALRQTEKLEILIRQFLDFKKAENATGNLTWSECNLEEFLNAKISEFKLTASQKCHPYGAIRPRKSTGNRHRHRHVGKDSGRIAYKCHQIHQQRRDFRQGPF